MQSPVNSMPTDDTINDRNQNGMVFVQLKEVSNMDVMHVNDAQQHLDAVINRSAQSHTPVIITGNENQAVLVALEDWKAIQETLHLLQVPGMREDLLEGMRTPIEECVTKEELDW